MTTTDTSEAPERIWSRCSYDEGETIPLMFVSHEPCDDYLEYVRADIHQSELDAAYERGLRDAARYLEPANEPDDWTDYAKQMHEASLRILALIPQPEEAGK